MNIKIEKEKRKIHIVCNEGFSVKGYIHLFEGERTLDFINHAQESFIVLTNAELYCLEKSESKLAADTDTIILNKSVIKWIEEI